MLKKWLILCLIKNQDNEALNRALGDIISDAEFHITKEEMYLGELARLETFRLETLRMLYQEREEFEKCNIMKAKIDVIKEKLDIIGP
jgi:hypothetical protein